MNHNHHLLQDMYVTITILECLVSTWHICLTEILEEKHLKLSDYLNQIYGPLATLSALQCFGFFWTPAAKATRLQELAGRFRSRLSHDTQNRAFTKNRSCIQILDTILQGPILSTIKEVNPLNS